MAVSYRRHHLHGGLFWLLTSCEGGYFSWPQMDTALGHWWILYLGHGQETAQPAADTSIYHSETCPAPVTRCHCCGQVNYRQGPDGGWVCGICHPIYVRSGEDRE